MMTANEKAATFIGWKPDDPCKMGHVACTHGDLRRHMPHDVPAPDMSRPDNYMKALEASAASNDERSGAEPELSWGCWDRGNWRCSLTYGDGPDEAEYVLRQIRQYGVTAGEAAISALAVLYDAEHLETKP